MTRHALRAALLLALVASAAPGRAAGAQATVDEPRPGAPARRAQAERRLRESLYRVTQRRVGLTDPQMTRLEAVTRGLAPQRAALVRREREARLVLRRELAAVRPDTPVVSRQLDELQRVRRERLALQEREAREIASFMGPVQRARYFALQEQLRRRVEGMRPGRGMGSEAPGGGGRRPPR